MIYVNIFLSRHLFSVMDHMYVVKLASRLLKAYACATFISRQLESVRLFLLAWKNNVQGGIFLGKMCKTFPDHPKLSQYSALFKGSNLRYVIRNKPPSYSENFLQYSNNHGKITKLKHQKSSQVFLSHLPCVTGPRKNGNTAVAQT